MNIDSRIQSRLIYAVVLVSSLALLRCTSAKKEEAPKEPVKAEAQQAPVSEADKDLPPELRNVESFDPATTLDEKQVQETDFYQVRKEVESNRAALDKEWQAQEQLDGSIRKAKQEAELRKKDDERKEKEAIEKARQEAIKNYNANANKRARQERIERDRAAKLPTISKEEVMWNGLED